MSKIVSDVFLAIGSAVLVAPTFQMREWTGVRSSNQWPMGAAVILMIVWTVIRRRDGFRVLILVASIIGIGFGMAITSAVHRAQLGRPPIPGLIFIVAPIVCAVLYIRLAHAEKEADRYREELEKELEQIRAMPPEERRQALEVQFAETRKLLGDIEQQEPSFRRNCTILVSIGLLLSVVTLPLGIWPEPKPASIVVDASIVLLCVFWLIKFAKRPPA